VTEPVILDPVLRVQQEAWLAQDRKRNVFNDVLNPCRHCGDQPKSYVTRGDTSMHCGRVTIWSACGLRVELENESSKDAAICVWNSVNPGPHLVKEQP